MRKPYCHDSAAQHGIAVDRFAREIDGILRTSPGALAATECQPVSPLPLTLSSASSYTLNGSPHLLGDFYVNH
jgi:hypothetical protein